MPNDIIIGDKKITNILRQLPKRIERNVYRKALREAAKEVLVPEVRRRIPSSDDQAGFEHMSRIRRNVKALNSKSRKNHGVFVVVRGRDVPVGQGKSRRFWGLAEYFYLVSHGNYKTPNRPTKGKGSRGDVEGIGNPMKEARQAKGRTALAVAKRKLIPAIDKEIQKLIR